MKSYEERTKDNDAKIAAFKAKQTVYWISAAVLNAAVTF